MRRGGRNPGANVALGTCCSLRREDGMSLHLETVEAPSASANPYLVGPYAATHDEVTLDDLEVMGEIPHDLNGVYVRNGPNPQFDPRGRYHWFDGDGMLHALHLADGQAVYRNRWIRTEAFERERREGGPPRYGVVGAEGAVKHFVPIDLPGPRLPHDMAITERHAILMDLPLFNDPAAAKAGRFKLFFDGGIPSRFGVIPRYGDADSIRWFDAEPCFIYHSVNAWDEGDEVVLDVCRVKKPEPRSDLDGPLAQMLSYLRLDAHLHRYRFDLRTGRTSEQPLDDDNTEFPSVNLGMVGEKTRFAYTMHISPEKTLLFDGLMKYDVDSGSAETYWYGDGRWGSEAPFAPRPGSSSEDDGYVLSYVYDEREERSDVEVLDARDVTAGPVCTIRLPVRVPLGFHATWVPGERLAGASGLSAR
jgi:carotenoid cleavage dioxygenase-like enzyme